MKKGWKAVRIVVRLLFVIAILIKFGGFAASAEGLKDRPGTEDSLETGARGDNASVTVKIPTQSPLFSLFPIASIDNEIVTLGEFRRYVAKMDEDNPDRKVGVPGEYMEVLNRIVAITLIVQEVRAIGLDEMDNVKYILKANRNNLLRDLVEEQATNDIQPNPLTVADIYKREIGEWKIKSVFVERRDVAENMEKEIKDGIDFDNVATRAIERGVARGGNPDPYLERKSMLPVIAEAMYGLEAGSVSPLIPVDNGFVLIKVEDVRYPENPEVLAWAKQESLKQEKNNYLKKYNVDLLHKYAKVNMKLYRSLDFEAKKPGFEKLLKDKRVIVTVKGAKPITVGELAEEIRLQFQHGIERAILSNRVNEKKEPVMSLLMRKRVLLQEGLNKGLDRTPEFQFRYKEYESALLLEAFIQKVIAPDIRITEEEMRSYYDNNIGAFSYPEMLRIRSLEFVHRKDAESALSSLRGGAEYLWVKQNAEGILGMDTEGIIHFDDQAIALKDIPEGLRKTLSGGKAGEHRLHESPNGYYSVLSITQAVPPRPIPFQENREGITQQLYARKISQAVESWVEKLKGAYNVRIYATDFQRN